MTHVKGAQIDGLYNHKLLKGWCGSAPGLIRAQQAYFTSAITRRCSFLRGRIICVAPDEERSDDGGQL